MMLRAYSKTKDGNLKLSSNFKVKEFACKDGNDTVFIESELINVLQDVRAHFNKPITINSGYRTDKYNNKIGGAKYSQHKYGNAADIKVSGFSPSDVYNYLDTKYPNSYGIGLYRNFVHIDVRPNKSRWNG